MPPRPRRSVGRNVLRKEGRDKVTGSARYVDDLTFPNLLYARTIRSTIPAGEIIDVRLNFDPKGFVVVDHRDIPGRNIVALIDDDQPCLAERSVRHVAEPVLLLAHEDREALRAADVGITYRPAAPAYDPETSTRVFKQIAIDKGDLDAGFRLADVIVEGEYRTGHQEQLYIEPNGVVAVPRSGGGITVFGSLQCPYYVHRALKILLDLPDDRVRVVQTETGGGFGGKEEYPSMIAGHAALLAIKSGRPVKLIYDRVEDMVATTKRHPAIVRHRTGVTRDGRLTAMEVDVVLDGGAYATLSAVVLSRGLIHASGPYRCDHVRIRGRAAMTNTPPNGAFRGFGAPQTQFAVEVHMDRIAVRWARSGSSARNQRAKAGRHDRDGAAPRGRLQRAQSAADSRGSDRFQAPAPRARQQQPRSRSGAVLPWVGIHWRWRGQTGVQSDARAHRTRRPDSRGQHRNRAGDADDARADCRRRDGHPLRRGRRQRR
jgi:CO/xanthine dehydrogenase Mo-binding subunit